MNNGVGEGLAELNEDELTPEDVYARIDQRAAKSFHALESFFVNLIKDETARQISDLKEEVSDLIGAQFDSFKVEQVADAVKVAVADGKRAANMDSFREVQKRYNVGLKHNEISDLIDDTKNIREKIFSKRQTLRTIRQSMADVDLFVKEAEAAILADITGETIPGTGKPVFSNDKARQAELVARKRDDENYMAFAAQYKTVRDQAETLEDEISSLDGDLKSTEMQFHAECKSLEAMTAEMNIYAAALGAGVSAGIEKSIDKESAPATKPWGNDKNSESKGW